MESFKKAIIAVLKQLSKTASLYVAVILIFSYHVILERDLLCTCKDQRLDCSLYMILPAAFILVTMLLVDKTFQRTWKFTLLYCKGNVCCILLFHILKALLVAMVWVASVLIDGDWYVCCFNHYSEEHPQLPCKDKMQLKDEEQTIIAALKNKSRVLGLPILCSIPLVFGLMSSIPWCKCIADGFSKNTFLHLIVLEKGENHVEGKLRKSAEDKLTMELNKCNGEPSRWFNVVGDIISKTSTASSTASTTALTTASSAAPSTLLSTTSSIPLTTISYTASSASTTATTTTSSRASTTASTTALTTASTTAFTALTTASTAPTSIIN